METSEGNFRLRPVLLAMLGLQLSWLGLIWISGTAAHWHKVPVLLIYSGACGLLVLLAPGGAADPFKRIASGLHNKERSTFALFLALFLAAGSWFAYRQLGWPDEGPIFSAARMVSEQGLSWFFGQYARLPWLGTQHPPLVPLLYGLALEIFGVHLFVARMVSLLLAAGTLVITYAIARDLYSERIALYSAIFLAVSPFFLRIAPTALSDMPMTFCFVLAVFLTLRLMRSPTYLLAAGLGVCIGAGLLCRYPMALIYPFLLACTLVHGKVRRLLPHLAVVILVSAAILAAWLGFAYHMGVLQAQWARVSSHAAFMADKAPGKSRAGRLKYFLKSVFLRVPSGVGPWNLPLLFLGAHCLGKRRNRSDLVVISWALAVVLPMLLTLPAPRLFFPAFPALAIAMACGLERLREGSARVTALALLYGTAGYYLFVDWYKAAGNLIRL
jgi:4-amino-4-deoxy-L-arabinose transferase-like glycosyltransferase